MSALAADSSLDYFGSDDSAFLDALRNVGLPDDNALPPDPLPVPDDPETSIEAPPCAQPSKRRRYTSPNAHGDHRAEADRPIGHLDEAELDEAVYGAAHFGDFGEYMRRKRAKLQNQDRQIGEGGEGGGIFKGLAIHINGHTRPSVQELRRLIVSHGGIFRPYLDKKSIVTHVITCSLTPAKIKDFAHMRLVRPEWILESLRLRRLLPWREFMYRPTTRVERPQGFPPTPVVLDDEPPSPAARPGTPPPARPTTPPPAPLGIPHTTSPPSPTHPGPAYAPPGPNAAAARAMAAPGWRAAHTAAAPDFLAGYYRHSRLHHLSTWKTELRALVSEAGERAERGDVPGSGGAGESGDKDQGENGAGLSMRGAQLALKGPLKGKGTTTAPAERVIMHVDFDAFFVSAGLVSRPELRGRPVVVCHAQGGGGAGSTSEIASASYEARGFGVRNGMSLRQARELCPSITTIPYEFELYKKLSLTFYTILMSVADDLQAVSVDEALIDVSASVAQTVVDDGADADRACVLAEEIRQHVKDATGCSVSIGIAHNILLARLATRRAKPAGSFYLRPAALPTLLATLDITDLHGFGWAAAEKARTKLGTTALGELVKKSRSQLAEALGKTTGEALYKALRGEDDRKLESDKPRRSVSCEINYGIRFQSNDEAERFVFQMAEEVSRRLRAVSMKGRSLTLKIMKRDPSAPVEAPKFMGHGVCLTYNKQSPLSGPLGRATDDEKAIGALAWKMLKAMCIPPTELRGIGIQILKLEGAEVPVLRAGQVRLSFKPLTGAGEAVGASAAGTSKAIPSPSKAVVTTASPDKASAHAVAPEMPVRETDLSHAPARQQANVDLPSFSQVDMDVFNALPNDVRLELEAEYQRRSVTPAPIADLPVVPAPSAPDLARITRQLAPRSRPLIGPAQGQGKPWFALPPKKAPVPPRVSLSQLAALGIDAGVFRALPVRVQREQLAQARGLAMRPSQRPARARRPIKAPTRLGSRFKPPQGPCEIVPPPPPPRARFVERPTLRRPAVRSGGEKRAVEAGRDVQKMIGEWVEGFREHVPHRKDVKYFGHFLERCVESDTGIERAVGIVRWWGVLLRRLFGTEEMLDEWEKEGITFEDVRVTSRLVGRAWWRVFAEIISRMNAIARERFGGSLAVR
ncbi:hypothetical protein K488DRAFT_44193 [Vararia minispora EC-137]|uniref:Uncharacterized protein n=1 Tax=Vararia minispora EC-137 TaxID=1314806 RepID=A0ACB8QTC1_9AGAM|nr:hypothetical protein K488DRAFT_44193 [Vararia minispora EC-137]